MPYLSPQMPHEVINPELCQTCPPKEKALSCRRARIATGFSHHLIPEGSVTSNTPISLRQSVSSKTRKKLTLQVMIISPFARHIILHRFVNNYSCNKLPVSASGIVRNLLDVIEAPHVRRQLPHLAKSDDTVRLHEW